jgi:hypothetical protein
MTVRELIAELQNQPQDALVLHAACDDYSSDNEVTVYYNSLDHSVTIGRVW